MSVHRPSYASSAATRRAIAAVGGAGLAVGSVLLHANGTIEVVAKQLRTDASAIANDFDRLDAVGAL